MDGPRSDHGKDGPRAVRTDGKMGGLGTVRRIANSGNAGGPHGQSAECKGKPNIGRAPDRKGA